MWIFLFSVVDVFWYFLWGEEYSLLSLTTVKPESFCLPHLFLTQSEKLSLFLHVLHNKVRVGISVPPFFSMSFCHSDFHILGDLLLFLLTSFHSSPCSQMCRPSSVHIEKWTSLKLSLLVMTLLEKQLHAVQFFLIERIFLPHASRETLPH